MKYLDYTEKRLIIHIAPFFCILFKYLLYIYICICVLLYLYLQQGLLRVPRRREAGEQEEEVGGALHPSSLATHSVLS